jgi:YHS domain-containing protein
MNSRILGFLTLLLAFSAWAGGPSANLDKSGVILQGYDPVTYFKSGDPQKGDSKIQTKVDGATYLFATEANKQEFLKEPKKFVPQFGGWCAYAVADSKSKVDVDPKSFIIQDGRLLLFYKGLWGNTREKWLHTKDKDAKTFLKEADSYWPEVESKDL